MKAALAIRAYTVDQVRPQLDLQLHARLPAPERARVRRHRDSARSRRSTPITPTRSDPQSDQPAQPGRRLRGRSRPGVRRTGRTRRDDRGARRADGAGHYRRAAHPVTNPPACLGCQARPRAGAGHHDRYYGPAMASAGSSMTWSGRGSSHGADDRPDPNARRAFLAFMGYPRRRLRPRLVVLT